MRFFTRPLLFLSTAISLLTASGVRAQATVNITVTDNQYTPAAVTAAAGDRIVFTYAGSRSHPTESDNGAFATFPMDAGHRSHTVTLNTAGSFGYHCQFHGSPGSGMAGTITILPLGTRPEAAANTALTTFPNPASAARDEHVTVSFTQRAGTEGKLRLLNVIGRVVREIPVRAAVEAGETRLVIDIANLPAGVYFTSLLIGERAVETRRLIIQP